MSGFSRCDYRAAQFKHNVAYGIACTGDYLIEAFKKSQHVPFQARHDCRLTTACANEIHTNKCLRAHRRLSPPFLFVKPTPCTAKEFASVVAFEEVYDCEMLTSEIERRPGLYDCLLKKYSG